MPAAGAIAIASARAAVRARAGGAVDVAYPQMRVLSKHTNVRRGLWQRQSRGQELRWAHRPTRPCSGTPLHWRLRSVQLARLRCRSSCSVRNPEQTRCTVSHFHDAMACVHARTRFGRLLSAQSARLHSTGQYQHRICGLGGVFAPTVDDVVAPTVTTVQILDAHETERLSPIAPYCQPPLALCASS